MQASALQAAIKAFGLASDKQASSFYGHKVSFRLALDRYHSSPGFVRFWSVTPLAIGRTGHVLHLALALLAGVGAEAVRMKWAVRVIEHLSGAFRDLFRATQQGRMREMGVPQLYSLRLVAEFSGLIKKRSGQFSITQQGEKFLLEENAGRLLNRLFVVHCQEFNLDFYDRLRLEHPEVQHAVAFSLYKLGQLDDGAWHALGEAIPALMLPIVRHAITRQEDPLLWNELQVEGVIQAVSQRFLEPMESFGLLELDNTWEATGLLTEESRVRLTPLFGKFINFRL